MAEENEEEEKEEPEEVKNLPEDVKKVLKSASIGDLALWLSKHQ